MRSNNFQFRTGAILSYFTVIIIMKIKIKMKNRSYRYDISRPRSRQGQNYSKHKVFHYGDAYMY